MSPKRFYLVMVGMVSVLVILIISAAAVGNKLLEQQAIKLADLRAQNQVVEDQRIALIQGKKDIEKYSELDSIAKTIVPQDKDQARTVREINSIAAQSGIRLQSIAFESSSLGDDTAPTAKPDASASGPNAAATPQTPTTPAISQVEPVEGIPGVFSLKIVITPAIDQTISYQKFLEFLERLENNRRTAHVDVINVSPASESAGVTFTLTLNVYLKP